MQTPLAPFRRALANTAVEALGLPAEVAEELERQIRVPEPERGDLALPCFDVARRAKRNPADAARQVCSAIEGDSRWATVEVAGPYVNVRVAGPTLSAAVVPAARAADYGRGLEGEGKTVVIDFSSPNIAKPLAFHHVRSTVIGAAIGRLHAARGWRVVGINYLGDWGKQFGLLATGFQRYGDPALRADAKHLVEVYVKANREADVGAIAAREAAPEEARALIALVREARGAVEAAADDKARKKAEKSLKSAEKKLASRRGAAGTEDVLDGAEAWVAELVEDAARAAAERPEVEARDQEARLFFKRLEEGEPEAVAEWREFRDTSIAEFQRVYQRMGIEFTAIEGESFYTDVLEDVVARIGERPGTRVSDGALIVDLPYADDEPPVLLKTRDGTTLYVTRDVAAAMDRQARFAFDRSLYVVAADQSLHFSQLFRTLAAMGLDWAERCAHVSFGRVHGMSTRRGNVVFLDEVLDEAVRKAREICEGSDKIDREHLDATVEAIGVGSIVFGDLRNLRASDYTFRWDDVVNFDGHTGPYVQYTHARTCSILAKGGGAPAEAELDRLALDEERQVMLALARFPEAVADAAEQKEPSIVTRALIDVAQTTASWLTAGNRDRDKRVLVEGDEATRAARLALVDAVRNVLAVGLGLLGVSAPSSM